MHVLKVSSNYNCKFTINGMVRRFECHIGWSKCPPCTPATLGETSAVLLPLTLQECHPCRFSALHFLAPSLLLMAFCPASGVPSVRCCIQRIKVRRIRWPFVLSSAVDAVGRLHSQSCVMHAVWVGVSSWWNMKLQNLSIVELLQHRKHDYTTTAPHT